jgi:hypothetical protein
MILNTAVAADRCAIVQVGADPDNVKEVGVSLDDADLNDVGLDSAGLGELAQTEEDGRLVHTLLPAGEGKREVSVAHKARTEI